MKIQVNVLNFSSQVGRRTPKIKVENEILPDQIFKGVIYVYIYLKKARPDYTAGVTHLICETGQLTLWVHCSLWNEGLARM